MFSVAGESDDLKDTLFLPRNFSVTTAERLRALVAGPPAFALRRRKIEDLEASIEASLPVDLATGEFVDRGKRWRPLPIPTLAELVERASHRGTVARASS